jgi:hypothetical protein
MLNNQTAVDIFHNRVNELIKEKKTITTFVIDGIWLECKEMEKRQIVDAWSNGFDEDDRATSNPFKYYNETYGDDTK